MMRKSESGVGYRLLWDDHVTPLFEAKDNDNNPIKLKRSMIPTSINGKPFYVLDANKWVKISDLRNDYSFDAAHIYVYRMLENGEKEVGIAKINSINNDFSSARDSAGKVIDIYEGFAAESGAIIHGAWLSNVEGNLMLSDVSLEDFSVRSEQDQKWYEEFLKIENGELKNALFMSYIITSGSKLTCFLQKTEANFKAYDAFNQFFPDIVTDVIKGIKYIEEETIVKNENPSDITENKVSALQNIAFQISETIQQGVGVPRVVMSTPILNLQSKEQKYSIKLFKSLLQSIKPKAGDALYDPSSPLYSSLNKPHYDSIDDNYWVKMITRFTIDGDQKSLTSTEKKKFYNGFLLLIQNDLYAKVGENWVVNPDSAFIKHEFLLSESFTDDEGFLKDETDANENNWKDDFDLVNKLDIVLQDKLGLPGFASLISGFMTFSETSTGDIHIDFVPHTYKDQNSLNSQFGLRPLDYSGGEPYSQNYLFTGKNRPISLFLGSLFINGFYHVLKGRQDTQSGSVDIAINQEVKPSTEAFLDNYFEVYNPRNYLDYRDAVNLILEGYKSKVSDQKQKNKANLKGRDELYNFLSKKVEDMVNIIFLPLPGAGYTQFDQFLENPEIWKSRTLKQAKNFLRAYIDRPSETYDFIGTLREILRTGNDGYITLKAPGTGGRGFARAYDGNALLEQGLRIPISHDELVKFLSFDNLGDLSIEAIFTLFFHFTTTRLIRQNKMSPKGYSLDANQWWAMNREEISVKAVRAYNTIINTFTQQNLGTELYNKEFELKLFVDRGAGINPGSTITDRFSRYGITKFKFSFTPNDPESLKNAVASTITYLYSFPDTFVVIKTKGLQENFLFADIYNIHTFEYVSESSYSCQIGGAFMWSGDGSVNGLTRENYDNLIAAYSDNFNDRDIRYLLGFDNEDIVDLILSKFQTMFNEQVDQHIDIIDLRH